MKIEYDPRVASEIARAEYSVAIEDIGRRGWRSAQVSYRARHDKIAEEVLARPSVKIACAAGCWYCCYYRVDVRAEEIFEIVDYVRDRFDSARAKLLREEVASNAKAMRGLSAAGQMEANLKCPFLAAGKCSIYEVRPTRCRNFHATDVEGCQQSYEQPTNLDIQNAFVPELFVAAEAHADGFKQALVDSGFDTTMYELNSALAIALTDSAPRRRFEKRKRAFSPTVAAK